jgi:large subunit ribosomal protein L14e
VNFGEDYGKVVTIVDIADASRVLVQGENFPRVIYPLKRLTLTKHKVPIQRGARGGTLLKAAKKIDLAGKWAASPIAKKMAQRTTRARLTDLERFQVMINRKKRSLAIRKKVKASAPKPSAAKKVISKKK